VSTPYTEQPITAARLEDGEGIPAIRGGHAPSLKSEAEVDAAGLLGRGADLRSQIAGFRVEMRAAIGG
jgi:hypothetical protein